MTRLTSKERTVLDLLANAGDGMRGMRGLDLVKESDGKLSRGTVYITLSGMVHQGLLESSGGDGDRPLFRITDLGRRMQEEIVESRACRETYPEYRREKIRIAAQNLVLMACLVTIFVAALSILVVYVQFVADAPPNQVLKASAAMIVPFAFIGMGIAWKISP